ncbi:MAG: RHS repeat domain-containing protein [Bryobacteraceae bacterium]
MAQVAFVYDSRSMLASATNPKSGTTSYAYDPNGNLKTRVDARGITTTYTYDALKPADAEELLGWHARGRVHVR